MSQAAFASASSVGNSSDTTIKGVKVHVALPEQFLNTGGSWNFGNAHLEMRSDGNLALTKKGTSTIKWQSKTAGSGGVKFLFTVGGDLEVKTSSGKKVWKTGTDDAGLCAPEEQVIIALQNDSNMVLYCGLTSTDDGRLAYYTPIWATGTNGI